MAVKLIAAAYKNEKILRSSIASLDLCSSTVEIITGPAPLCERVVIVPSSDTVYFIFPGTVNLEQWKSNLLKFRKVKCGQGEAHKGFMEAYLSIKPLMQDHIDRWCAHRIVVGGHSRGSGKAICFMMDEALSGLSFVEAHLFGCPRTLDVNGSYLFNNLFLKRCWNWVVNNDAVFRVPFRWMGFRHVGKIMYFDENDRITEEPGVFRRIKGQIFGRIKGGLFDGISDHDSAKNYERLVCALSEVNNENIF